jgi:RNA polymerase sigma-70 factor, ECF subfamily
MPVRYHSAMNLSAHIAPPDLQALWPDAYNELRTIAARLMAHERPDHTLVATALVNEAYLRLQNAGENGAPQTALVLDKNHLLALASRVMRNVLVDYASARRADKRGALATHMTLSNADHVAATGDDAADVLAVNEALRKLARLDARAAQVCEMKVFGGLDVAEMASVLGVSEPTIKRDWVFARVWLAKELQA